MKEFSNYEYDLLTISSDEKDKYAININPNTKIAKVIKKINKHTVWMLGECNDLAEKLFRGYDLDITYENI